MKNKKEKEEKKEKQKENKIKPKRSIDSTLELSPLPKVSKDVQADSPSLPGSIALFRQSFKTYQEKFWILITLALIPFVLNIFFGAASLPTENLPLSLLKMLLAGFVGIWSGAALYVAIGEKATVIEAYQRSLVKFLPYFGAYVLVGLIIFGGLVLFIVPGVVFAIWFCLALFAVVFEKDKGFNALFKSRAYIKGREFDVLSRIAAFILFYLAVILIASLMIFVFGEATARWLTSLLFVFVSPLGIIYLFFIYQSLKKIKPEIVGQKISGQSWLWAMIAAIGLIGLVAAFFLFYAYIAIDPYIKSGPLLEEIQDIQAWPEN